MIGKSENVKNLNFLTKIIHRQDKKIINRGSECWRGQNIEPCQLSCHCHLGPYLASA